MSVDLEFIGEQHTRQWWERDPMPCCAAMDMERFRIERSRLLHGLPHALTEEEVDVVIEAKELMEELTNAFIHGWPGIPEGDYPRILNAVLEEHGMGRAA